MGNKKEVALAKFYLGPAWPIYSTKELVKLIKKIEFKDSTVCPGFWTIQSGSKNQIPKNLLAETNFILLNEVRYPTGQSLKATYFGPK